MGNVRAERRQLERDRNAVEREPVSNEGRGLPVVSVWQQNTMPSADDPGESQERPRAWRWDNDVKVSDQPLSVGGGKQSETVVVPERALRQHRGEPTDE
jgi:hypothetical protein